MPGPCGVQGRPASPCGPCVRRQEGQCTHTLPFAGQGVSLSFPELGVRALAESEPQQRSVQRKVPLVAEGT